MEIDDWKMYLVAAIFAVAASLIMVSGAEVEWRSPPAEESE